MAAKKKRAAKAKKKPATKKKSKTTSRKKTSAPPTKVETFPEGEEGIDLVCAAKAPHAVEVQSIAVNPTGRFVVAGDAEGGCRVIDIERGEMRSLSEAMTGIAAIAFVEREVALITDEQAVSRLVDLRSGEERVAMKSDGQLFTAPVSSMGRIAYASARGAYLWRAGKTPTKLDGVDGVVTALAFDDDVVIAAVLGGTDIVTMHVCDARDGLPVRVMTEKMGAVRRIVTSAGRVVAITGGHAAWAEVVAWDASGRLLSHVSLKGFTGSDWVTLLDDSSSSSLRVACAQTDKVAIIDALQGTVTVRALSGWLAASGQAAHGNLSVVLGYDAVALYDVAAGTVILERKCETVERAALSSDRVTLAVCNENGDVAAYRAHPPR
jgi:hypothetical protein